MYKIRHLVAAAGSGLLALGGVAVSTGIAQAGTGSPHASAGIPHASATSVASCSASASGLQVGVSPACTSSGTVRYPTSITLSVHSDQLSALLNPALGGVGQGIKDSWGLECYAGTASILKENGTFEVTSSQPDTSTQLPLHSLVPSSCKVTSTVSTLLGASETLIGNVSVLGVSGSTSATTATPGSVRNDSTWCADTRGDSGTPGNVIQIWKCLSDSAQRWIYSPKGELVHEGRCLGYNSAGAVALQACTGADDQIWNSAGAGKGLESISGRCLGVAQYRDGVQLRVYACRGGVRQGWVIPATAPASQV